MNRDCNYKSVPMIARMRSSLNNPVFCEECEKYFYFNSPIIGSFSAVFGAAGTVGGMAALAFYDWLGLLLFTILFFITMFFFRFLEISLTRAVVLDSFEIINAQKKQKVRFLVVLLVVLLSICLFKIYGEI